MVLSIDRFAL